MPPHPEEPWGKDVVLVAVTGWGGEDDRHRSREAGFDAHMVKPVDHDVLMTFLASNARRRANVAAASDVALLAEARRDAPGGYRESSFAGGP